MLSPAQFVIDKFGGLTGTAKAIGVPVSTVQGWKERKRIPQEHWRKLMDAAKAADVGELSLSDFVDDHPLPVNEGAAA